MLILREGQFGDKPLALVWAIYFCANLMSFVIILTTGEKLESVENFFRILNGIVGFYMFQSYFKDKVWDGVKFVLLGTIAADEKRNRYQEGKKGHS